MKVIDPKSAQTSYRYLWSVFILPFSPYKYILFKWLCLFTSLCYIFFFNKVICWWLVWFMVFNATFNNISVIIVGVSFIASSVETCKFHLTFVSAQSVNPSSFTTFSTLSFLSCWDMWLGSLNDAENWKFSRTVSPPITTSSW